jgi:hypothetical protein
MRKHIRVTNPTSGAPFTSRQRAKRYIAQGMADWVEYGVSIRLIRSDHRVRSVARAIDLTIAGYDRDVSSGDIAAVEAIQGLPIAGSVIRLLTDSTKTPHAAARGKSGPVRVIMHLDAADRPLFRLSVTDCMV